MPFRPQKIFKVGVIGLGRMGERHIRNCLKSPDVDLVAVHDNSIDKENKIALEYDIKSVGKITNFINDIEIAIISVPTELHAKIAKILLSSGIHCLIEKPITLHEDDAKELIAIARKRNVILAIGHTERFNPCILKLKEIMKNYPKPFHVKLERLNALTNFVYTDDVILDLMIHDIDLINFLGITDLSSLCNINFNPNDDINKKCIINIKVDKNLELDFHVSRSNKKTQRKIIINYGNYDITADLYNTEISTTNNSSNIDHTIIKNDALEMQLEHFLKKIKSEDNLIASGTEALLALSMANKLRRLFN